MEMTKGKTTLRSKSFFNALIDIREVGVLIPIILAVTIFGSLNPDFFSYENAVNVLRNTSFTFITAIGMTFVLISAGLDISIGAQLALGGLVTGYMLIGGIPVWLSILGGIFSGILCGVINGYFIEVAKVPPFITTIGTMYIFRGIVLVARKGEPIYPLPKDFSVIGQGGVFGIPYIVIIALFLGLIAAFVLKYTIYGRMIYAVGGNAETARLSGIPVRLVRFSTYIMIGMLATFTGVLYSSRFGSVQPGIGSGYEMTVIAAVIIGGTSLFGGAGTILGTLLGSFFMTILTNGMTLVKISPYWQQLVLGAIIIAAVALDQFRISLKK